MRGQWVAKTALLSTLLAFPLSAADYSGVLQPLEAAIAKAIQSDDALLAPARFQEAKRLYEEAEAAARKGESEQQIRARADQAARALAAVTRTAETVRGPLAEALAAREAARKLDPAIERRLAPADKLLSDAATRAEAGNSQDAGRLAQQASLEYARAGAGFLGEVKLAQTRKELNALRGTVSQPMLDQAEREFTAVSAALQNAQARTLADLSNRIGDIVKLLYPKFFWDPPMTLQMGGYTLYVEAYERRSWDFQNNVIIGATGTAWLSFQCQPVFHIPNLGLTTVSKNLAVVEAVRDATKEISLADARIIDQSQTVGSSLQIQVPAYARTAEQISDAVLDLSKFLHLPKGDIKVRFENLTIRPGATPDTGIVMAGTATYPTDPPVPETITLHVAGFTVYIHKLVLTTTSATATGELEMPVSIVDPGTGHPGRVPLGDFAITNDCQFRRDLPTFAFGPWSVGNTEMLIRGTGVIADFDKSWAPPGLPAGSAALVPSWRGVILDHGDTIPAAGTLTSNSAYLRANYQFSKAEVTGPGLKGSFKLAAPFEFFSLQPVGYRVRLSVGQIELVDSALLTGVFQNDKLSAPTQAATSGGGPVEATYIRLAVNANLDLQGFATVAGQIRWGEYTKHGTASTFYRAEQFDFARFYLSGTYKTNYFPLDAGGSFVEPDALLGDPTAIGIQGLTVFFPRRFTVLTPDTPGRAPLVFRGFGDDRKTANWLNLSFGGVHGRVSNMFTEPGSNTDLGPVSEPFYVGQVAFKAAPGLPSTNLQPVYSLMEKFVSSASFDCDMRGKLHIPAPVDSDMDFTNMAFTSVAQNAGGKLPFTSPLKLSYWGLDMVKKPGATSGGVISVRTGQVLFTAAGIREQRHFDQPFYLTWGEMLANGSLRRLVFDYNSAGQKFDRFHYTTSFVRLSDYDPANTSKPAFLKVAGTAHIDFFGAKYINLHDIYDTDPAKAGDPWNARRISLMNDSLPGSFSPTDTKLQRNWSDDFGNVDFDYTYDDNIQDGFVGTGKMGFLWIAGTMRSSIVVKAERICMSISETDRKDFTLGPAAHFGAMSRTTGCGCIVNGQLDRMMLSAELENTADVNILLRSASYGSIAWMMTPTISTLEIQGDMYLNLLSGSGIEVQGHAKFTVDRAQDFVEGEVDGKFDTNTALGAGSVTADGQLNWHLGKFGGDSYQSIQGKLAVAVVTPVSGGSAEGGFYIGINAPKNEAWVLTAGGPRFPLDLNPLPARLTGVYGYVKASSSINLYVFSGGIEAFAGLGGFVATIPGAPTGVGLPYVVGNVGIHIWGDILGGLVSAGGWADLNVIAPYPFAFEGTLGLEGCVLWVFCGSVDVTVGLSSADGLFVR